MSNVEEKEIRNLGERMARIETKMDILITKTELVDQVKDIAVRAENKADAANARVERADRWVMALGGTTITTIVVAVLNLILKGGG